ncbi:gluconokinase [Streptomyces ferrugineus]|uniref:Gluconokinase n=1 Tax=Streptomyces ferrugineus TaxID=1413221 RepID=A0A7M2SQU9_9ACTN|nr:gluconokinase [Streptomyces ferrugineus]QOV38349.1 gluconokinase [Streptomyces ferrugineus]
MSPSTHSRPPCIVVIGVSGTGKTTTARLLAKRLDIPFAEADDLHPSANIAKMSAGVPLDDADRQPWLEAIGRRLREGDVAGTGCVVACSALKRRYRDTLRAACPGAFFLHLTAGQEVLEERIGRRTGHFMPKTLIDSQLAALEPLEPDERGAALDAGPAPPTIADKAMELLARR